MKERRINEIKGIIFTALGIIILTSLIRFERLDLIFYTSHPKVPPDNLLGVFGAYLGGILVFLFGRISSFFIPFFILFLGANYFRQQKPHLRPARLIGALLLLISVSSLTGNIAMHSESIRFYRAGLLGSVSSNFISAYFGKFGCYIIFITLALLSFALVSEILLSSF
ncbi:MAG: hypothetical protein DRP74_09030, partial [Candidatus Omnitrophota bacterium]